MRFSLTYPEYRLLDIKALTEYHMACVATDLDFASDQSLLSLNDTNLRVQETEMFKRFCDHFYHLSRLVDLDLFWEIFHTIAHLGQGDHVIKTSHLVMNYSIDIDDFLSLFTAFSTIAYSSVGDELLDIFTKGELENLPAASNPLADEIILLTRKLDDFNYNGVIAALDLNDLAKDLGDRSLKYFFRELFFCFRSTNAGDKYTAKLLAESTAKDIQAYIKKSLVDSYSKIWFDGETVLSIYSDLPALRSGLTAKLKTIRHSSGTMPLTYEAVREDYVSVVRRLTFIQDNNKTAVYEKYIAGQAIQGRQSSFLYNLQEQTSMLVSQSSDGKACATIDKPLNKTAAHKQDNAPMPTIEPGVLLTDIYNLDKQTSKSKVRSKLEVLALPQLRGDFAYSLAALHKYPIISKNGTAQPQWEYSHHSMACIGLQGQTGLICERPLPMYHCIQDILEPELDTKKKALDAVWASVCAKADYRNNYTFAVNFADIQYLSNINADTSCRSTSIGKVKPYIQFAMKGSFNATNWLFESWCMQKPDPVENIGRSELVREFKQVIQNVQHSSSLDLKSTSISKLSTYKRVVNEVYRLDAALKADGYSFSKFWYIYLADNFIRNPAKSREISDATEYIDNALALPVGYQAKPTRYSANAFAATHSWVRLTLADTSYLAQKLSQNVEGTDSTNLSCLRHKVICATDDVVFMPESKSLDVMKDPAVVSYAQEMFGVFRTDSSIINMPKQVFSPKSIDTTIESPSDTSLATRMLEALQFLVSIGAGSFSSNRLDGFIADKNFAPTYTATAATLQNLSDILEKVFTSEDVSEKLFLSSVRYPFLLLSIFYTMTMDEFELYRQNMRHRGVIYKTTNNPLQEYDMQMSSLMVTCNTLCIASIYVLAGNKAAYSIPNVHRLYVETIPHLIAALLALGDNFQDILHKLTIRLPEINRISEALMPDLSKCNEYIDLIAYACRDSGVASGMSDFMLLALESFGDFCINNLERLNIQSCLTQEATSDDIEALLFAVPVEDTLPTSTVSPEYKAVEYMNNFINNRGRLTTILSSENIAELSECPYYVYLMGKFIKIMYASAKMHPQVYTILRKRLYLEADYKPFSSSSAQSPIICEHLYNNVVRILDTSGSATEIAQVLGIPGSNVTLDGTNSIYNIAQYGSSSYDRKYFGFVQRTLATSRDAAGPVCITLAVPGTENTVPYYLHVSGIYICGAADAPQGMKLYYSSDDVRNASEF